jgi:anaerobic nitric oxide reductase flavorubredoxin
VKRQIVKDVYSVGVVDWNVRNFHGHTYTTKRGSSYNAYLVIDERTALVDTVYEPFADELIENIRNIISLDKISYIVANHVEKDHSGALPEIMKLCPNAQIIGTAKCKEGLYKNYYGNWNFKEVKTGDSISLGKKALTFVEAPMIHWPDSMFTYLPQEELLMSNDAFGQHLASSFTFTDEVDPCLLWDEVAKYYANILWPLGGLISRKIAEVQKLNIPIKIIAPAHGLVWRKEPMEIIQKYLSWADNQVSQKAVIVYETMWGATEKMARKISEGIFKAGVEFKIFDINNSDRTEVFKEMLEAKFFILGSSTHGNSMLPSMAGFLDFLRVLAPKKRFASVFGSFGWAGGAVREIEKILTANGISLSQSGLSIRYAPDEDELNSCVEFGRRAVSQE